MNMSASGKSQKKTESQSIRGSASKSDAKQDLIVDNIIKKNKKVLTELSRL